MLSKIGYANFVCQSRHTNVKKGADNTDGNKNSKIPLFFEDKKTIHEKTENHSHAKRYAFKQRIKNQLLS